MPNPRRHLSKGELHRYYQFSVRQDSQKTWTDSRRLRVSQMQGVIECSSHLPITPAYIRSSGGGKKEALAREDVEDACRSFENYLVEMIVEEGKVRDLMDVEELLYCWKNLKCPVFINLVCRFYGELCKDLFSSEEGDDVDSP
ncbi:hypothetical protein L1049_014235 [Liquidambar formosana]|uniref:OVATE domain-containing protein n=1 Tax=Liquidambar formosana TaxID=63359 RepID=A0AAP0RMZ6_LIQFO